MIRNLKQNNKEVETIMDLWLNSTIKAHPFIEEKYWENNYTLIKEEFIPKSDVYVYLENDKILGFISIINKEFIGALFVDVDAQGKGVGKKLIQHASDKFGDLSLTVYKENSSVVNFYKNNGFIFIKEEVNEDTQRVELFMIKK